MDEKKVKAAKARSMNLSPERRSEIAKKGAIKRWHSDLPKATHSANIIIGGKTFFAANLDNGMRILSESGIASALKSQSGGAKRAKRLAKKEGGPLLPVFMASKNIIPFIPNDLKDGLFYPVSYIFGNSICQGYEAKILPQICKVFLDARNNGALHDSQKERANAAETLIIALANVGIDSLIDEATGFEKFRVKGDLNRILESFLAKELVPWVETFPDSFYENLFKIRNMQLPKNKNKRPKYFSGITNNIIYKRLAPCLLEELKRTTPRTENGNLKHHYHRKLNKEFGHPKLKEHISSVIALMKASDNYEEFKNLIDKAFPIYNHKISDIYSEEALKDIKYLENK